MLLALTIICVWSCNDDDSPRVVLFDVQIVALYPEDFNRESAEGVTIVIRNNATGSEKEAISGPDGRVRFADLVPGTYHLSASKLLESSEAIVLTGSSSEINLNYLNNTLQLTEVNSSVPIEIRLSGSISGSLVIRQVYYSGSKTPENTNYFFDQL